MTTAHFLAKLRSGHYAYGTTPEVRRYFLRCLSCHSVVPLWRCVISKVKPGQRAGCVCGCSDVRPSRIPGYAAAYWLLVRGILIRKWILRLSDWDPRIPYRPDGRPA
jgi:hypothetical protein